MRIKHVLRTGIAAAAFAGATSASAAVINFDQTDAALPAGNISYGGNGGPAFASAVRFDDVSLDTGAPPAGSASSLFCQGCALNFATGLNQAEGPSTWTFGSLGSSFMITGDVFERNAAGDPIGAPVVQGTLASGFFTGTQTVASSGTELTFDGGGSDVKSGDLLNYFGIDENTEFTFAAALAAASDTALAADGSFNADVIGAQVSNTNSAMNPVPEPASVGLFGIALALVGLGFGYRRSRPAGRPNAG